MIMQQYFSLYSKDVEHRQTTRITSLRALHINKNTRKFKNSATLITNNWLRGNEHKLNSVFSCKMEMRAKCSVSVQIDTFGELARS